MSGGRLRLLVVNWQDIENPQAGGAEIHLHEIFGRLARRGHEVTLLCSGWEGAESRTVLDGIEVHRVGRRHSFTLAAWPYYLRRLRRQPFDLIVEDINKLPLYTPLWGGPPVVALVPHLFGATAFQEATLPAAATLWLAERPIPYFYAGVPVQAISESTADDLEERGLSRARIRVIYPGIDHEQYCPDARVRRFPTPVFVYVGRLKRYKGLERVIDALALLRRRGIGARLLVAGTGDHEPVLRAHAAQRAPGMVEFLGFVPDSEKVRLLRQSWTTVYPSPKEGWGISNIEAAACGTPAVSSNSPGLRESVVHEVSGLLVGHADVEGWSSALQRIAGDAGLREKLGQGALQFARRFSWDRTTDETEAHLLEATAGGPERSRDHFTLQAQEAK